MSQPTIDKVFIRDVQTGKDITQINTGDKLYLDSLPKEWNFRANASNVNSVEFILGGKDQIENLAPWVSFGDSNPLILNVGSYVLKVIGWEKSGGKGNKSSVYEISFTIKQTLIVTPPPVVVPPPIVAPPPITPSTSGIVNVGPHDDLETLINKKNHDIIYNLSNGANYNFKHDIKLGSNITIQSIGVSRITLSPQGGFGYAFSCDKNTNNVTIKNLEFITDSTDLPVLAAGKNINLIKLGVISGGGLTNLEGVTHMDINDCYAKSQIGMNFIFSGGQLNGDNYNVTINNPVVPFGSKNEHCIRLHSAHNVVINNPQLDNTSSPLGKHPLNLRDGSDFTVNNGTLKGPIVIGPLEIAGNENKTLKNVTFNNVKLGGWTMLYSGLSNLNINGSTGFSTGGGGIAFSVAASWAGRHQATGKIVNANMTSSDHGATFINDSKHNIAVTNCKFNGKTVVH